MIFIIRIHMSPGGSGHEHIASVVWQNPANGDTEEHPVADIVNWINKGGEARVTDGRNTVAVRVWNHKYLRTHADGKWSDNLLSLPRY